MSVDKSIEASAKKTFYNCQYDIVGFLECNEKAKDPEKRAKYANYLT